MSINNEDPKDIIEPEIVQDVDYKELDKIKKAINKGEIKKLCFYERLRKKFADRLPRNPIMNKVSDYLFLLPDFFMLLCRLMVEKRVDNKTKTFILGVIAYVIMPIDIIPDFIPVIGFVDDLIIVAYALDQILKYTDEQVILDNWSGKTDLIITIKKILAVIDSTVCQRLLLKTKRFFLKIKIR